ncbi:MAG: acyltransferase [Dyadobacter sp.]|uniref:acyltransferase family protein n=1 Tax=Dyadobacter sp. TaxID=1914288 RepID=UPI001B288EBB|nr:acyltransferase [Dyadobacter sp.]MBO9611918.1 acyltransferase [Dyadobacter sp.]
MHQVPSRTLWIDYLRSFLTVLVVAHHSSLAYTTFASFDKVAYIRSTHPVVDMQRWIGLDIFENFNDVFFMSLMFLIAGLFVVRSIQRKGPGAFARDRFYRLFIPFIIGGTILNLVAHYPAHLLAHGRGSLYAYVEDFFILEQWPVGPPWFIWVLFTFNILFALIYTIFRPKRNLNASTTHTRVHKPVMVICYWFLFTFALYVPFAFWLGPYKWIGFGPFDFQISRAALYFGYFLLGAWLGYANFNETIFSTSSPLVRRWPLWLLVCVLAYTSLTLASPYLTNLVKRGALPELDGYLIYYTIYVLSCTFSCIAFITTFRALVKNHQKAWDSLSDHAYLIYLLHYPFVLWMQYWLLDAPLSAVAKFTVTVLISVTGAWALAILLRKIPIIKEYL